MDLVLYQGGLLELESKSFTMCGAYDEVQERMARQSGFDD
jgi:hypothetical protein